MRKCLTVSLVRYSRPFFRWIRDHRTRKMMTMHKTLLSRDDVDKFYITRNERGSGLAHIEDSVDIIHRLEEYIKKSNED